MKSKGLGDTIEKFTTITGIKKINNYIHLGKNTDDECGCKKRKDWLNEMFPYKV